MHTHTFSSTRTHTHIMALCKDTRQKTHLASRRAFQSVDAGVVCFVFFSSFREWERQLKDEGGGEHGNVSHTHTHTYKVTVTHTHTGIHTHTDAHKYKTNISHKHGNTH